MLSSSQVETFAPTADWATLRLRADLMRRVRGFFEGRGFLEVETPLLSAEVVVDRHLEPPRATLGSRRDYGGPHGEFWLQSSPEAAMKRLMAAGGEAIYQVTRAFRGGEAGPLHNPEFTIVEWYRRGDALEEAMQTTSALCQAVLATPPARLTRYADAWGRYIGIDPHTADTTALVEAARRHALIPPQGFAIDDRDGWLDWLLTERVQPELGRDVPEILYEYPASQAALARLKEGNAAVAERFELFIRGIELANGFDELTDAGELRERFATANAQRVSDGKSPLPEPSRLLAAMQHGLPSCAGVALGFDRLVMLAADAHSIDQVMAFPIERA